MDRMSAMRSRPASDMRELRREPVLAPSEVALEHGRCKKGDTKNLPKPIGSHSYE